jgi:DnaK suppressor protein
VTKTQRAQLEKALMALRSELTSRSPRKLEPNRTNEAEVGGDEDEQPLNEMSQAIASNRNKNDAVMVARVERALAKLRDEPDDYGVCEECGEDIADGRLKAMPYAELCVACQSKKDPGRGGTRKKLTDYV